MEKWKDWLSEKGYDKWFCRDNLIILILVGVLLFIIALPTDSSKSKESLESSLGITGAFNSSEKQDEAAALQEEGAVAAAAASLKNDYAQELENRLSKTLSKMAGVGKVEVMVTLLSSEELVVEKDGTEVRSNTNERDTEGGTRIITQMDTTSTTIYSSNENRQEPYVVKTLLPKVEGVLVVAEGAGTGTVSENITRAVQALFGVEAHKVQVVKMAALTTSHQ